ncbi:MAG: hypothetical protein V3R25_10100 [Nitrosomonadaceae bacterium]
MIDPDDSVRCDICGSLVDVADYDDELEMCVACVHDIADKEHS